MQTEENAHHILYCTEIFSPARLTDQWIYCEPRDNKAIDHHLASHCVIIRLYNSINNVSIVRKKDRIVVDVQIPIITLDKSRA